MIAPWAFSRDLRVIALGEQLRMVAPEAQDLGDQVELDAPIVTLVPEFIGQLAAVLLRPLEQRIEHLTAQCVINRAAIVGIHQTQIPQLRALINIGHTR